MKEFNFIACGLYYIDEEPIDGFDYYIQKLNFSDNKFRSFFLDENNQEKTITNKFPSSPCYPYHFSQKEMLSVINSDIQDICNQSKIGFALYFPEEEKIIVSDTFDPPKRTIKFSGQEIFYHDNKFYKDAKLKHKLNITLEKNNLREINHLLDETLSKL